MTAPDAPASRMSAASFEDAVRTIETTLRPRQGAMVSWPRVIAEARRAREAEENAKALLKDICDEWNEDCEPGCDSYGHEEACKAVDIAQAKKALRAENARLAERVETLEKAIRVFVKRHDEIQPHLDGVFALYMVHGGDWPREQNWKAELDAMRALVPTNEPINAPEGDK